MMGTKSRRVPSPTSVAFAGLTTIAVAMGIGRFAFTPILPMMKQDAGLSLADGGRLASANYVGFLLGAVLAMGVRVRPTIAMRGGLVVIGIVTVGMGFTSQFASWILLRTVAGIANAWVQIFAFAWFLEKLAAVERPLLNGVVFAGVGTGMAVAGGFCLVLMQLNAGSAQAWIGLGMIALIATAAIWRFFLDDEATDKNSRTILRCCLSDSNSLTPIICFGASGFGYIIPATFLPVMARRLIADPLVFGWSWPVFGAAAAIAPLATAGLVRLIGNRRLWMLSHLVMAFGVALPVLWPALSGIIIASLLIGATFMINTMASMQEARAVAAPHAASLMAAMIAAFGSGQIAGPILASSMIPSYRDFSQSLLVASAVLIVSAYVLSRPAGR
jgi:MFS family permease